MGIDRTAMATLGVKIPWGICSWEEKVLKDPKHKVGCPGSHPLSSVAAFCSGCGISTAQVSESKTVYAPFVRIPGWIDDEDTDEFHIYIGDLEVQVDSWNLGTHFAYMGLTVSQDDFAGLTQDDFQNWSDTVWNNLNSIGLGKYFNFGLHCWENAE